MEAKLVNTCEIDISADGTIIKREIKIDLDEYCENFEHLYEESECLYPDINLSEVDPLNVDFKQEVTEENIVKSEEIETNIKFEINNENGKNVMDTSTSDSPVSEGKYFTQLI